MSALLAAALLAVPVRSAETLPDGVWAAHFAGGLALVDIGVPVAPIIPVLTADAEVAYGLGAWFDVRGRYSTRLGVQHTLGPELRGRITSVGGWSLAGRVFPSVTVLGAYQEGPDYAGDVATLAGLVTSWRGRHGALIAEAGVTIQWLLFEHLDETDVDATPYLAYYDLALEGEYPLHDDVNLTLRLELAVPGAPDDPFTVAGGHPRLLFGGNFTF